VSWACPRALSVNVLTPRPFTARTRKRSRAFTSGASLTEATGTPPLAFAFRLRSLLIAGFFDDDDGCLSCSNYVYLHVWQAPFLLLEKNDSMRYIRGVEIESVRVYVYMVREIS